MELVNDMMRTSATRKVNSQSSSANARSLFLLPFGKRHDGKLGTVKTMQFFILLLLALVISGCTKEDDMSNLKADSFSGTVTAKIENGSSYDSQIKKVWALLESKISNGNLTGLMVKEGEYSNGGFTVSLIDIPDQHLMSVQTFFSSVLNVYGGELDYSDPNARMVNVDFWGMDSNNSYLDYFTYTNTASKRTTCVFVFSDRDVTIKGGKNVGVMLQRGWNRIYWSTEKVISKAPNDMKWYLHGDVK